ncbi:MAG: hypothetical protein IJI46_00455 [Erysipelotrichaceae bacterium]|nr:hypothetical protein [Erysipelotrichaceae bacterium]
MKCPSCNGVLYFDIKKQKLKCQHCESEYEVKDYDLKNDAQETIIEGARMYTCKNCGAQLISANDEAVSYCSYCGSEAVLESQISGVKRPKYIVPFKIDKEQCKSIYQSKLKNKFFVPKEFRDPEFIEKFRPFYIPYWMYTVKFREDPFDVKGTRRYSKGDYDYYEEYDITARIRDNGLYGIPFDASRNFDDTIAEHISPFTKKGMVKYRQGYLAGMYADAPNVEADLYKEEVMDKATEIAVKDLKHDLKVDDLDLPRKKAKLQEFLQTSYESEDTIYLPVWFLTWRKNDRVAYAVVNGQSGKMHIDLPADLNVFSLYTAAGAGLLFILLTLFVSVTSRFVIWFAAVLVYLVGRRYRSELKQIRDRENHVFDKGYLLNDAKELLMSEKKRSRIRRSFRRDTGVFRTIFTGIILSIFLVSFFIMGEVYDLLVSQTGAMVITFIVMVLEAILFIKQLAAAMYLRNKRSVFICLLGLGSVIYAFAVAAAQPVQDWWYYLGALICLFAASSMSIDLIMRYNETSTRPLPSFYTRKGGDDRA